MALPPSIPTSFVPHPSGGSAAGAGRVIGFLALGTYALLGIVVIAAIGVFLYGRILDAQLSSRDAALAKARSGIDAATVSEFIRLRDRLVSGETLLAKHPALSNFFTALESILPSSVRLSTLTISFDDQGAASLEATGVAKSFNALAAASSAFSADGRIKDAIFSNISVESSGGVSFSLAASLDPKLVAFTPAAAPPAPHTP